MDEAHCALDLCILMTQTALFLGDPHAAADQIGSGEDRGKIVTHAGIGAKKARRIVPTMLTTNAPAASVPQQSTSKELQASSLEKGLKHGGQTPEVGPLVESAEQEMKGYGLSIAQMAAAAGKSAAVKQS